MFEDIPETQSELDSKALSATQPETGSEALPELQPEPEAESAAPSKKPFIAIPSTLRTVLITVFACIFVFSSYLLIDYYIESRREAQNYEDLSEMVGDVPARTLPTEGDDALNPDSSVANRIHYVTVLNSKTGEMVSVLPQYADLFSLNPDFVGWLQIPNTTVNYPVMQTPEESDYYLYRNFYGSETKQGSIFADGKVDLTTPSDNIILHGHHMRDGTMFGALPDYKDQEFYEEHKYIFFDTLTQMHTYEVMAVFVTSINAGSDFPYYQFIDAIDEQAFDSFVRLCKGKSLYDTGVNAVYGNKLLTLSTCEYTEDNNRLVIVAKCID